MTILLKANRSRSADCCFDRQFHRDGSYRAPSISCAAAVFGWRECSCRRRFGGLNEVAIAAVSFNPQCLEGILLRPGCIIAELTAVVLPNVIDAFDQAVILHDFLKLWERRVDKLSVGEFVEGAKKSDLQNFTQSVQAIAHDADAKATFEYKKHDENGQQRSAIVAVT